MTQPPQYSFPTPAYGSPYGPRSYDPPSQTMARWALGLSIVACIPFGIFVGVGLAIAVLVRSRHGINYGRGKAIAALIIAGLWFVAGIALTVTGVIQGLREGVDAERDASGHVVERTEISVSNLRISDCFDDPVLLGTSTEEASQAALVDIMPCAQPHYFEVYQSWELAGDGYPGEATVTKAAEKGCFLAFKPYVGKAPAKSKLEVYYYYPQKNAWRFLHDRQIQCILGSPTGLVKGSFRGSAR